MTPVKNWTALRTSGVARKMESTAASAMRITRDLMLSPLVRSNMTTDIVTTNGTTAITITRCWIEVYYFPPLFSHITLPLTLFNSFHLFLSSPVSQTLWSTVPAAQAPCLSRCQLFEAGFSADTLHLNDPSCNGTLQDGRVEFLFDNENHTCGTTLRVQQLLHQRFTK